MKILTTNNINKLFRKISSRIDKKRSLDTNVRDFGIVDGVTLVRRNLGLSGNKKYSVKYNGKKVGTVSFSTYNNMVGDRGAFPESWYGTEIIEGNSTRAKLRPHIWINELVMNDRFDNPNLVSRDKKFGIMTLQAILSFAVRHGFDDRIGLMATKLTDNGLSPNKFYAKAGFNPFPLAKKHLELPEKTYNLMLNQLLKEGKTKQEAEAILASRNIKLPEKLNGQFVTSGDNVHLFLDDSQKLIDYEI